MAAMMQMLLAVGGGGGGFTPLTGLTGLIGWWDASVTASLTITGGTNVNSVADQSGGGNTMNKVGSSNFPQYNATGFNTSHPAIVFSGSALAALGCASFPMGSGNSLTVFYVGTLAEFGSSGNGRFVSYSLPGVHDDFNFVGTWQFSTSSPVDTTKINFFRNSVNVNKSGLTASPAGHRIILTIDSGGGITLYVDGVSVATGTSGGNWNSGGSLSWGRDAFTDAAYMSMTAAELGVATGFSNATTVGQLDTYLKTKWGL